MLNGLYGHHAAHIRSAGGVADHSRAAADENNGLVARHLQALHKAKRHKMTDVQRIGGRVKADVEGRFAAVYHFFDFFFVGDLSYKASGYQFLINSHFSFPLP